MDTLEKKSVLERIDCATEQIENVVMSLGLLTISGIVFANVIARYFFQTAFAWSEELARYVVVWVTFLESVPAPGIIHMWAWICCPIF